MTRKDPNCPNCSGRSFSAYDPDDIPYDCGVCETPTVKTQTIYAHRWPEAFKKWADTPEGKKRLLIEP